MEKSATNNPQSFIKTIKIVLGISVVLLLSIIIGRKCFFITSEQAFINTKLVTLRSPITGIVHFSEPNVGAVLEEGKEVFEVANPLFGNTESNTQYNLLQNLIDNLENEMAQNIIYIRKYEIDYQRFKRLKEVGGVSKRDFDEIENKLSVLKATVENQKNQLTHLKQRFEEIGKQLQLQKGIKVTAPCKGVVWAVLSKEGEHVDIGAEIIQLVNPGDVWVDAFFSEKFAARLRPGMRVTVSALGSKEKWNGEIVFIRGGSGRVMYNSAVEIPPAALTRRLIAVRIKIDWKDNFNASEFYGIGRSMVVSARRY
ncbi:MAG: HlyD family efflux transporter periplasmic adaptor subunit [Candidatus Omnitrophica bacterium]|nr:HlyD family efflux transporter periplasmic adaptor subunit [Candidatus Omnitrophota bacterium]